MVFKRKEIEKGTKTELMMCLCLFYKKTGHPVKKRVQFSAKLELKSKDMTSLRILYILYQLIAEVPVSLDVFAQGAQKYCIS